MAEVTTTLVTVYEVIEHAIGGGVRVHGRFTTQEEAQERYAQLARRSPELLPGGSLALRTRSAELLEPLETPTTKMRRHYEDKGYAPTQTTERLPK